MTESGCADQSKNGSFRSKKNKLLPLGCRFVGESSRSGGGTGGGGGGGGGGVGGVFTTPPQLYRVELLLAVTNRVVHYNQRELESDDFKSVNR